MGNVTKQGTDNQQPAMSYGQGITSSVGAGFALNAVPGMYEGRPERFFDDPNDPRARGRDIGDAQVTRDAMYGSSLLDLPNDPVGPDGQDSNHNLPEAAYLPAVAWPVGA